MCNAKTGLVLFAILITQVCSSGVFELELRQFNNDNGLLRDGSCCKGTMQDGLCTEQCSTYFRICLTHYQTNIDLHGSCTFGEYTTDILGNNSFLFPKEKAGFTNPLQFPITFAWKGDFSLIIQAYDESSPQGMQLIGEFADSGSVFPVDGYRSQRWNSSASSVQLRYALQCDENYFGSDCNHFCTPRNDDIGHYECDADGSKICRQGWQGEYCAKPICLEGCKNGSCKQPNECSCNAGWQGRLCDECIVYPGCQNGYCQRDFQCICFEGWGGLFCNQDLNYCTNNKPCRNGGTCENTGEGYYTCTCPVGFTGDNCEIEVNNCHTEPCVNGGQCQDIGNDYNCECPLGYTGQRCEIAAARCRENPCAHGGSCEPIGEGYRCHCAAGWNGVNCQQERDECASHPCLNDGHCVDGVDRFSCVCRAGFSGDRCEVNRNECSGENPCRNGGQCVDGPNAFECRCQPGFVGALCEINVDECVTRPCTNGGSCVDKVNDFECVCAPGFTGRMCSEQINECASSPCRHGASCSDLVNGYQCHCTSGFEGRNCQYLLGSAPTPTTRSTPTTSTSTAPPVTNVQAVVEEPQGVLFTRTQMILIVCFGSAVPMILLLLCVSMLLYRRYKRRVADNVSPEEQENTANSMNNKLDNVGRGVKAGKYGYPTADSIDAEIGVHQIPLDFKNESLVTPPSKLVNKDFIKDTNAVSERQRKTNNTSVCPMRPSALVPPYQQRRSADEQRHRPVSAVIHPVHSQHQLEIPSVSGTVSHPTLHDTSERERGSTEVPEVYINRRYTATEV